MTKPTSANCGVLYRREMREGKGPRGGRRTSVRVVCTQCGVATEWTQTRRAGSGDEECSRAVDEMRGRACAKPRALSTATRMLHALAAFIELLMYYLCLFDGVDLVAANAHLERYRSLLAPLVRKRYASQGRIIEARPLGGYRVSRRFGLYTEEA